MRGVDRGAPAAVLALCPDDPPVQDAGVAAAFASPGAAVAALPAAFASPGAAVAAEVARIALVLRRALKLAQLDDDLGAAAHGYDAAHGHRELARLAHPIGKVPRTVDPDLDRLDDQICARRRANAADLAATAEPMPIDVLARRAGLDAIAFELFVLALAPEIDEGFARVYQLLGGKPVLDVAIAARVVTPGDAGASTVRRALAPGGALATLGLLELTGPDGAPAPAPMLATALSVPASVIAYVLGHAVEDPALRRFLAPARPVLDGAGHLPAALLARVAALLADPGALPLLEGPAGAGKRSLVRAACRAAGRPVIELELTAAAPFAERDALAAARLAWLGGATLLIGLPAHDPEAGAAPSWQRGLASLCERVHERVVLCRNAAVASPLDLQLATSPWRLSPVWVPTPEPEQRALVWRDQLGATAPDVDVGELARGYPLTGGAIRRIASEARVLAEARADGTGAVRRADVIAAIEAALAPQLETVGRRLVTEASFEDLVIPDETRDTLMELAATICLRDQVLDAWKFRRLVRGRGVSALFYGDPGTGKTMAAGVIAATIGLPLYQIDTASLVSKWVGETEKNLAQVFRAAEAGQAMLLFDEADAIFGKRTEVQNATDRYANMQTNFLLTQLELFNGVSILTTNRESGMDAAFKRRLTFRVYFPPPEAAEREAMWRQMLAGRGARCAAIDWAELAEVLPMSGGYIRNAVLRAGYLAAASEAPITTELLHRAATLVLRDAGKVI
jgi:SpoVK/Ycf46/Vps4 family AAA+-type ATPase